ncbi:uncharacterized protein PSANT_02032 [Moesziomyces antarcticus]|uniref:Uncharacterized protein n=2 Tax=Pseudozyma antarctica TaxID=84753 RepID=A0A5C3FL88_PSEA2|nr:uncharacterized protein PSANT_02032 [Moesziomyces antarcticus]
MSAGIALANIRDSSNGFSNPRHLGTPPSARPESSGSMAPVASRLAGGARPGAIRLRRFLSKYGLSEAAVANAVVVEANAKRLARILNEFIEGQQRSGGTVVKREAGQADTAKAETIFGLPGTDITSKDVTVPHSWTLTGFDSYAGATKSFVGQIHEIRSNSTFPVQHTCVHVKLGRGDANMILFYVENTTKLYEYVVRHMVFEVGSLIYVKDLVTTYVNNEIALKFTPDSTIQLLRPGETSFDKISRFNARINAEWSGLGIDTLQFEQDKDDGSHNSGYGADGAQIENTFQPFLEKHGLSQAAVGNILNIEEHAQSIPRNLGGLIQIEEQRNGPLAAPNVAHRTDSEAATAFRLTETELTNKVVDAPHSWMYGYSNLEDGKKMSFVAKITRPNIPRRGRPKVVMHFCSDGSTASFSVSPNSSSPGYATPYHFTNELVYVKDLEMRIRNGVRILEYTYTSSMTFIRRGNTSFDDISRFNARLNADWSGHSAVEADKNGSSHNNGYDTDDLGEVPIRTSRKRGVRRVRFSP